MKRKTSHAPSPDTTTLEGVTDIDRAAMCRNLNMLRHVPAGTRRNSKKVKSSTWDEKNQQKPVQAAGQLLRKQICRKGQETSWTQAESESAVCPSATKTDCACVPGCISRNIASRLRDTGIPPS